MTVAEAFRQARIQAARHMAASDAAVLRWGETTITEIVMARAAAAITVVPFTQHAEALGGADWVWWWVDGSAAYGMLVQAKRLTKTAQSWRFDFDYPNGSGTQRRNLRRTAAILGLLPAYAVYLGTGDYRGWQRCSSSHRSGRCIACVQRTVSLMPALLAEPLVVNDAPSTYERSVALEDVQTASPRSALLIPALRQQMSAELEGFLTTPQGGVRAVTRSMMDRVLRVRYGAFSAVSADAEARTQVGPRDSLGQVFQDVPRDRGHWELNYFDHVLGPLVHAPPAYVLEIMTSDYSVQHLADEMPDSVAGVVVVRLDGLQNDR